MTEERTVKSAELAEILKVDRATIYRWCRQGMPVYSTNGNQNQYSPEACKRWAKKRHGLGANKPEAAETKGKPSDEAKASEDVPEDDFADELQDLKNLRGDQLKDEFVRAKVLKERELARIQRARAEREEGTQIPIADVKQLCTGLFALLRAELDALPSKLSDKMAGLTEPRIIHGELKSWVTAVKRGLQKSLGQFGEG